ncbi:MAG: cysteine protease StiP family protein [Kineosporiaceae bacterium]|nr:cysteine protease StiP family protein [Kineosporiaceae bacterium]MBK7624436.1 cysteine protease StiP family protein [Kineosporiaceae bacterium]MBK8077800.1 cysteine protease StiP family protein [Kineosporiaceae bacterium]
MPTRPGSLLLPDPLVGPAFGSYAASDVRWLLTDLSAVALEAPQRDRERAIQSGRAHYSESLPVEFRPDQDYVVLFRELTTAWAPGVAEAVGILGDRILAHRTSQPVLVSLARAGTPLGILARRWFRIRHGLDVPHLTMSIIRDKGLDPVALRWLAANHRLDDIVFVDGWTGKGAITRQLATSVREANARPGATGSLDPQLAVVADPGRCTALHGTTDDILIPSACLNATVSGLVSRTVHNASLGPGQFHGAKFYRELTHHDQSTFFLDAVTTQLAHVVVGRRAEQLGPAPDWRGWEAVTRIAERRGMTDLNLIKPGIGETTRVLLRRSPHEVLLRSIDDPRVRHLRRLADTLGVHVTVDEHLPYAAVGLIAQVRG